MTRLVISNLIKKKTNFYIKLHFSALEEYDVRNEAAGKNLKLYCGSNLCLTQTRRLKKLTSGSAEICKQNRINLSFISNFQLQIFLHYLYLAVIFYAVFLIANLLLYKNIKGSSN
jgi:hypothetical protein